MKHAHALKVAVGAAAAAVFTSSEVVVGVAAEVSAGTAAAAAVAAVGDGIVAVAAAAVIGTAAAITDFSVQRFCKGEPASAVLTLLF